MITAEERVSDLYEIPITELNGMLSILPELIQEIKEYAKEVARQVLKDAAENATCDNHSFSYGHDYRVDKDSILNTEIITP